MQRVGALVSCGWLSRILSPSAQHLKVLDARWYMPGSDINSNAEYTKKHIPGAEFFDIDACTLPQSPYSHTLPTPDFFADYVGNLGICNETHVVVYDNHADFGVFSAPRVWWLFRVFGHNHVYVLNGGLPQWIKEGHPVASSTAPRDVEKKTFSAVLQPHLFKRFEDMTGNLEKNKFQVMDARSAARFKGEAPEPREGLCRGHMPGSINVPFSSLLNGKDAEQSPRLMKSPSELEEIFTSRGIDLSQPLTASCGSGITACIQTLAAFEVGKQNVAMYDGSWEEYAQRATPNQMVVCNPEEASAG
ncbi:3-mercaptopyruvate sulfurtransferase-like [Diadema antillarum]|uniref:3-mercaptopyruvate sulfurtransferase-like n=1 Tax=Diadema antillarum TaxID=105358 RepID=UPI003A8976D7